MLILIGFKDWMFETLDILILEKLLVYESYIERKIMKRTFTTKEHGVKKCLELVHTNICKPFSVHAQEVMSLCLVGLIISLGSMRLYPS